MESRRRVGVSVCSSRHVWAGGGVEAWKHGRAWRYVGMWACGRVGVLEAWNHGGLQMCRRVGMQACVATGRHGGMEA